MHVTRYTCVHSYFCSLRVGCRDDNTQYCNHCYNQSMLYRYLHANISFYIHPGFSFGGLLACSITAAVWDTPYIRADVLKRSLVCVTFGQPHIALPAVAKVAREQPEMVSVIHTIHLQDDVFPRLLSVLNECCSELGPKEEKGGIKLKAPSMAKLVRCIVYHKQ